MSRLNKNRNAQSSRRAFLKQTGQMAGVSALAGVAIPKVHAAQDQAIRIALVGCGGRGTGAAFNALAAISSGTTGRGTCRTFAGHHAKAEKLLWRAPAEPNPYKIEWDHFIRAIHADTPYNEAVRGAEASLVTSMGRMAAHTGKTITYQQMASCEHEFAPEVDQFTDHSPAPLTADAEGRYPVPQPGLITKHEYL